MKIQFYCRKTYKKPYIVWWSTHFCFQQQTYCRFHFNKQKNNNSFLLYNISFNAHSFIKQNEISPILDLFVWKNRSEICYATAASSPLCGRPFCLGISHYMTSVTVDASYSNGHGPMGSGTCLETTLSRGKSIRFPLTLHVLFKFQLCAFCIRVYF